MSKIQNHQDFVGSILKTCGRYIDLGNGQPQSDVEPLELRTEALRSYRFRSVSRQSAVLLFGTCDIVGLVH